MRRKDREMPEEFALEVADKCEWAVMSMITPEGAPYSVPLSIARKGKWIYFHCARQGLKTDCLRENCQVCIVCVGDTNRGAADEFTTEYESAIIQGCAWEVTNDAEKVEALRLICERHTPQLMSQFDVAVAESLPVTAIWKVSVDRITGKRKKYGRDGKELKFGKRE